MYLCTYQNQNQNLKIEMHVIKSTFSIIRSNNGSNYSFLAISIFLKFIFPTGGLGYKILRNLIEIDWSLFSVYLVPII